MFVCNTVFPSMCSLGGRLVQASDDQWRRPLVRCCCVSAIWCWLKKHQKDVLCRYVCEEIHAFQVTQLFADDSADHLPKPQFISHKLSPTRPEAALPSATLLFSLATTRSVQRPEWESHVVRPGALRHEIWEIKSWEWLCYRTFCR